MKMKTKKTHFRNLTTILMLILSMITLSLTAQPGRGEGRGGGTPDDRAKRITGMMKQELKLTADQEKKVSAINLKYAKKMDEMRKNARGMDEKKADAINMEREAEFKTVLSPDQFKTYRKLAAEMKNRQRGQGNGPRTRP